MIVKHTERKEEIKHELRGGKGDVIAALAHDENTVKNVRLYSVMTLKPGVSIGYHEHINETEYYHILDGNGVVVDDGKEFTIAKGDTMITTHGHSHSIENTGDNDLVFLATIVTH